MSKSFSLNVKHIAYKGISIFSPLLNIKLKFEIICNNILNNHLLNFVDKSILKVWDGDINYFSFQLSVAGLYWGR